MANVRSTGCEGSRGFVSSLLSQRFRYTALTHGGGGGGGHPWGVKKKYQVMTCMRAPTLIFFFLHPAFFRKIVIFQVETMLDERLAAVSR